MTTATTTTTATTVAEPGLDEPVLGALRDLTPISLAELDASAALQTRRDRKYLVEPDRLADVLATIGAPVRVLDIAGERCFSYRSTYFDTPELLSYHQAARSRPSRFKVRTRTYVTTGTCWLEVKGRTVRGETVKDRIEHPSGAERELDASDKAFLAGYPQITGHVDQLTPALVTMYRRATLHCGQRVTIDAGLRCERTDGSDVPLGDLADLLVIESKSIGHGPGPFDRALWRLGIRPSTISKYAVGTAAALPMLPANKYHRVLHRHVGRISTGGMP